MPISYRNPNNMSANPEPDPTALPVPRIPSASLDPFVGTINKMANAGILNSTFANQAIVRSLRNRTFAETGEISERMAQMPGQLFPSAAQLDDETLAEFNNIAWRQLPRANSPEAIGALIPREHTDSGGFLALLENFARLNYAISGAVNATINLAQGETEETNILKEAWRGFTMKDRETMSYVLRNLGWTGEDGATYYVRGFVGFVADVVTDPLTFTKAGSKIAAAVRQPDSTLRASSALRADQVKFLSKNGAKMTPQLALSQLAEEMVDESIKRAQGVSSIDDLAVKLADPVEQQAANVLAKRVAERRAREALKRGDKVAADDMLLKAVSAEERLDLINYATKDVIATFDILAQNRNVQAIDKLMDIADKSDDFWRSLFTQMTVDPEVAYEVTKRLLQLDNLAMTKDGLRSYLVGADILSSRSINRAGLGRMLDPGGLSIKVPFKPIEFRLARTQFLDSFKLALSEATSKSYRSTKEWLTGVDFKPISGPAKLGFQVVEGVAGRAGEAIMHVSRIFNISNKKNPQLTAILRKRNAMRDYAARQAQSVVTKSLSVAGKPLDNTMNEVLYDALAEAEERAMIWMENQSYFDRKLALQDREIELKKQGKSPEEIREALDALEKDPSLGYDKKIAEDLIKTDKRLDTYDPAVRQELSGLAAKQDELFRDMYDAAKAHGSERAFMAQYLPTQYANLPESMKFRPGRRRADVTGEDPFAKVRKLQRSQAIKPEADGGLGLTVNKDLFNLLYQRHLAAEFAQIERQVAGQIVDSFGIHPGQINRVMDETYGPTGVLAQNLLGALRVGDGLAERMWTESEVLEAFPRVQELKDLVETGEFNQAVEWIQDNAEIMSLALVRGKHSLHALFAETMNESVNTLVTVLDNINTDHNLLLDKMTRDFGLSGPGLESQAAKLFPDQADQLPMLAVAYGLAFERAVQQAALTRGMSVSGGDLMSQFMTSEGAHTALTARIVDQMGDDAARLFTLHALVQFYSDMPAVQKVANDLFAAQQAKLAAAAEAFADGVVGAKLTAEGVGYEQLFGALMGTYSKTAMWELFEKRLDGSRSVQKGDLFTGAQAGILDAYDEALEVIASRGATPAEQKALIAQLNSEAYGIMGQHPLIAEATARYGYTMDTLPKSLADDPEYVESVIEYVRAQYRRAKKADLNLFRQSPYVASPDAKKTAIRRDLQEKIQAGIEKYNIDNEAKEILRAIALRPGQMHTGLQWAPQRGIVAMSQAAYRRQFAGVLRELRGAAEASVPDIALKRLGLKKIAEDMKLTNPVRYSQELAEAEFKLMTITAERLKKIVKQQNMADPDRALAAIEAYETALHASMKTPFEIAPVASQMQASGRTMREAYQEMDEAITELREAIGPLFSDPTGQQILTQHMFDSIDESLKVMQSARAMAERISAVRRHFHTWTASNARLLSLTVEEVEPILKELDDIYAELRESGRLLSERQNELYVIEEIALGEDFATRLLANDEVQGNFWTMRKDLRDAKGTTSTEAVLARHQQYVAGLQKAIANSKEIAKRGQEYEKGLREALEVGRIRIEQIEAVDKIAREAANFINAEVLDDLSDLRLSTGIYNYAVGVPRADKIVNSMFTLMVADKWLKRGDFTAGSWNRAIDDLVTNGSDDKHLGPVWEYFSTEKVKEGADPNSFKFRKRFVMSSMTNVMKKGNDALAGTLGISPTSSMWMTTTPATTYAELPDKLNRYLDLNNKAWGDITKIEKVPSVTALRTLAKELDVKLPEEFGGRLDVLAKKLREVPDSDLNIESFLSEIKSAQRRILKESIKGTRAKATFNRWANNALLSTEETQALFEYAQQLRAHEDAWREVSDDWIETLVAEANSSRQQAEELAGRVRAVEKRPIRGVSSIELIRKAPTTPRWYSRRRQSTLTPRKWTRANVQRLKNFRATGQLADDNVDWWMRSRSATLIDEATYLVRKKQLLDEADAYDTFAEYLNGLHVIQTEIFEQTFKKDVEYANWATDPEATELLLKTFFPDGMLDDIPLGQNQTIVPGIEQVAKETITGDDIANKMGLQDKQFHMAMSDFTNRGLTNIGSGTEWNALYEGLMRRYEAVQGIDMGTYGAGRRTIEFDDPEGYAAPESMFSIERQNDFQTWLESAPAADEVAELGAVRLEARDLFAKLEGKPLIVATDLEREWMERVYVAANTTTATVPDAPEFMQRFLGDIAKVNNASSARQRGQAASWFAREARSADLLALRQAGARHFYGGTDYDPAMDDLLQFIGTGDAKHLTPRVQFWARVFGIWDFKGRPLTDKQRKAIKRDYDLRKQKNRFADEEEQFTEKKALAGLKQAHRATALVSVGPKTLQRFTGQVRRYTKIFTGPGGKPIKGRQSVRYKVLREAISGVTDNIVPQANKLAPLMEQAQLAQAKLPALEAALARAEESKKVLLQLGPEATPNVRAMRSMINYMQFRSLQQQHVAFSKLLAMIPHPDDQAFVRILTARQGDRAFGGTVGKSIDEIRTTGAAGGGLDLGNLDSLVAQADAYTVASAQWSKIIAESSQAFLTRLGIDLNVVHDRELFVKALDAAGIKFDEKANMWVRGLVTDPVTSSVDVMDLNSMINDVMSYFRVVDSGLPNAPILEAQAYTLTRILRNAIPDPGKQQIMLYAVTGMTDLSSLTALQAAHAISFLGSKTNTEITELGLKAATDANYDHVKRVAAVQGRLPKAATVEATPEDFVAPPGSPHELVRVEWPALQGQLSNDGIDLGAGFYVERHVANAIDDAMLKDESVTGPIREMLARVVDPVTNTFKYYATAIHPAFVIRNIVDGFVRSMLALGIKGLNLKRNYDMYKIMSAKNLQPGERFVTIRGQRYDALFLRDMFERHGGGVTFEEKLGITRVGVKGITDPRLHPFADNFIFKGYNKIKNVVDNINGSGDNMFRLNIFIDGLEQGMVASDAITRMHKVMFDYQYALSPFERDVMRRIFPFYTFSRFNVPLALEIAFKHPGYYATIGKANMTLRTGEGEEYERLMPSYIKDNWMFSPRVRGNELHVTTGRNIFAVEDIGAIGDMIQTGNIREGFFDEIFSRMNPMLKLPIEFAVGKNLYFKNDILEDSKLTAEFVPLPGLKQWLDIRPVIINGEQHYRVNGRNWHLLQQSHFARSYRSLAMVFGENRKGSFGQGLVALLTGLRSQVVELDRRMLHIEGMANYNAKQLNEALRVGDVVKLKRLTGTLERDEEDQADVVESLKALRAQVKQAQLEEQGRHRMTPRM